MDTTCQFTDIIASKKSNFRERASKVMYGSYCTVMRSLIVYSRCGCGHAIHVSDESRVSFLAHYPESHFCCMLLLGKDKVTLLSAACMRGKQTCDNAGKCNSRTGYRGHPCPSHNRMIAPDGRAALAVLDRILRWKA